jgi:uncharacterized protein YbjT (DUF2867 family)
MKVILFGATGMVGQGVLRECLHAADVETVLAIGRNRTGQNHSKLREIQQSDFVDYSRIEPELSGYDACFFCLGISSTGMSEEAYTKVTYDVTLAAARTLAKLNPKMTFIYVSGAGTDSTEQGRVMWARVKGQTENALRLLPFKAAYMFRPGIILPQHGEKSRTPLYRWSYLLMSPLLPVIQTLFPNSVTTTERVGRAMLVAARHGAPKAVLEAKDINALGF